MLSEEQGTSVPERSFAFGVFCLNPQRRTLSRDGQPLPLTPKEFDTLLALVQAEGRVVEKEELLSQVWPDCQVGDGSLARNISVLRRVLGHDIITTVPRRGYRLSTAVSLVPQAALPPREIATPPRPLDLSSGQPQIGVIPPRAATTPRSRVLLYAALIAVLSGIAIVLAHNSITRSKTETPRPLRLAVLPFANYTSNPKNEYLCDGITEAMISELSRLNPRQLAVIARTSAIKFKNTDKSIPEIARELKLDYIMEGSVRSSGDRLHITTQLVRGSDASHVWSGEYDRTLHDILDVQQQVSVAVAQEIHLTLDALNLHSSHPVDPAAYQDYLLGRFYWSKRNQDGLLKSVEYFERALARDPTYAQAYAGLADAYLVLGGGYLPDIPTYDKARMAAQKALGLDNTLADAYTSLAYEEFVNERDMTGAERDFRRALALNPNSANAHHWYALYLSGMKRFDEAIFHINGALRLDPLAIAVRYNAAAVYRAAGRYDEAVREARKALEIDFNSAPAHGALALAYESQGLFEQAIAEFQTAQKLRASYSPYAVEVAHMYALEGNKDRAKGVLGSLLSDPHWGDVAPLCFAETYAALGQKDKAFYWLKRCVDDRSCTAMEINDQNLDLLRSDPHFSRVLHWRRLGGAAHRIPTPTSLRRRTPP